MNNVFITYRYDGDEFDNRLAPSLRDLKTKCVSVNSKTESKYISDKIAVGIETARSNNLIDHNTVVVLCNPNIYVLDQLCVEKLEYIFTTQHNVGVVGIAGVKKLNSQKNMYDPDNNPVNGVFVGTQHKKFSDVGYYTNVVGVDDTFIAIRGKFILNNNIAFKNINTGIGINIAFDAIKAGYDVVCADIDISILEHNDVHSTAINYLVNEYCLTYPVQYGNIGISVDVEL